MPLASESLVLNALRHQRFGHGIEQGGGTWQNRAQRLTASEVWARSIAPRLKNKARDVLNALRHQRFGHSQSPLLFVRVSDRAQRLTASEVWARA